MSNFIIETIAANGNRAAVKTNANAFDFSSVRIGTDNLAIVQGGTGVGAYLDLGARSIRSSFTAVNPFDLVNKAYADAMAAGLLIKDACRLMTDAALPAHTPAGSGPGKTLTANANGLLALDGVSTVAGDRVLITTDAVNNGIYVVTTAGSAGSPWVLTRTVDFDGSPVYEVRGGCFTFVQEGTNNSDSGWVVTNNGTITVDVTSIAFTQFSGAGQITPGNALQKVGNILNVLYDDVTIGKNGSNQLFIKALSITTSLLADASVTEAKLAASVAGNGLIGGAGTPLAVGAGDSIKTASDNISVDYAISKTNDNASPVTLNQVVYFKTNGNVDVANKTNATFATKIGVVEDASILAAASGKVVVRPGKLIPGFTGLVIGRDYYVTSLGAIDLYENLALVSGEEAFIVGHAMSATELMFMPKHDHSIV